MANGRVDIIKIKDKSIVSSTAEIFMSNKIMASININKQRNIDEIEFSKNL